MFGPRVSLVKYLAWFGAAFALWGLVLALAAAVVVAGISGLKHMFGGQVGQVLLARGVMAGWAMGLAVVAWFVAQQISALASGPMGATIEGASPVAQMIYGSQPRVSLVAASNVATSPTNGARVPEVAGALAASTSASGSYEQAAAPTRALVVANTNSQGVYLRKTPRLADRLVAWPDGTHLQATGNDADGDGYHWVQVTDPKGNVGWVPADYVEDAP